MTLAFATLHLLLLAAAPRSQSAQENEPVIVPVKVTGVSTSQPVATLEKQVRAAISPRDLLFVQTDGQRVRRGRVILTSGQRAAGQLDGDGPIIHPGTAVVLRAEGLASLCRFMPREVTVSGRISRLPPGRATAWADVGRLSGIQKGDRLLVRRETVLDGRRVSIPIARGEVVVIDDSAALMTLQPVVGNALPEMGDSVELWPAPGEARMDRVNSAVLAVIKGKEGDLITVVGSLEDGFAEGRTLDLFRGSQFIGSAEVTKVGFPRPPLTQARLLKSTSPHPPREADVAIRRAPPGPPAPPLRSVIFRIEGNYCLVAAGEVDGVQPGEKLVVPRIDPQTGESNEAFELTADKVNLDYVGCFSRQLDPVAAPLKVWEWAERRSPRWPQWRPAGIVVEIDATSRILYADIETNSTIQAGDIIEIVPGGELPPAAAVVLWRTTDRCVATIPDGWGDPAKMEHGQILIPGETARPGFTTSAPAKP